VPVVGPEQPADSRAARGRGLSVGMAVRVVAIGAVAVRAVVVRASAGCSVCRDPRATGGPGSAGCSLSPAHFDGARHLYDDNYPLLLRSSRIQNKRDSSSEILVNRLLTWVLLNYQKIAFIILPHRELFAHGRQRADGDARGSGVPRRGERRRGSRNEPGRTPPETAVSLRLAGTDSPCRARR
jgi:hypothetical protein